MKGDDRQRCEPDELRRLVSRLARRYRQLVTRISSAELLADELSLDLAKLEECFNEDDAKAQAAELYLNERNSSRVQEQLRRVAESGALGLEIKRRSDGVAEVSIDSGQPFTLSPVLADLLYILAVDTGLTTDELIGWKSLDEVAILLGKKEGRKLARHAVTQSIYRLRRELFNRGGVNPFLVQTNRWRGVRFALKRKKVAVIEND
jgi:hypothetical protein